MHVCPFTNTCSFLLLTQQTQILSLHREPIETKNCGVEAHRCSLNTCVRLQKVMMIQKCLLHSAGENQDRCVCSLLLWQQVLPKKGLETHRGTKKPGAFETTTYVHPFSALTRMTPGCLHLPPYLPLLDQI